MHFPYLLLILSEDQGVYTLVNSPGLPVAEESNFNVRSEARMDESMTNRDLLIAITNILHREKYLRNYAFLRSWHNQHSKFYSVMLGRVYDSTNASTTLSAHETGDTGYGTVIGFNDMWCPWERSTNRMDMATNVDHESSWHTDGFDKNIRSRFYFDSSHEQWNTGEMYEHWSVKDESGLDDNYPGYMTPVTLSTSAHTEPPTDESNMTLDIDGLSSWNSTRNGSGNFLGPETERWGFASESQGW